VIRVANLNGRLVVAGAGEFVDVHEASGGRFGADPQAIYEEWSAFCDWAAGAALGPGEPLDFAALGPPVPAPRQVFAVALNYRDHAGEAGLDDPVQPLIFTKYPTCLTGPRASVALPTPYVDWEVELVVVIGRRADAVSVADAWQYAAGVTIGQDLSARDVQRQGPAPQFSLGKSFPGFGPTGPWVRAHDAATIGELELECLLNGERVQQARTSEMTFSVPELIAYIASICPLLPGDLLFTGTPAGVGSRREPPVYLRAGDELVSRISGLGEIVQTFRDR
jgi:2-keto-4-pentenoate hydratase/2-oxohepta-3-ene-1,7-dioic acid hydratase in catechol pathway